MSSDSESLFKLAGIVQAHEKDVRCLAPIGSGGGFVTGSRDNQGKVLLPSASGKTLVEAQLLSGPLKYVSCCCVLPSSSSDDQPDRIYLGSHDHDIYCFTIQESTATAVLRGHSGPVSALAADPATERLLSGSWDCTAILWKDNVKHMIIMGHTQSVLAVAFLGSQYLLTASADKSIKCWYSDTIDLRETFMAHDDAVRGLHIINDDIFMSVSNDGTLRRWSLTRGLLKTYQCHDHYVYAMAWLTSSVKTPDEKIGFVTCSEDGTVKVFVRGKLVQVIPFPKETIWSVVSVTVSEIALASSTGRVYIFTTDADKAADEEQVRVFHTLTTADVSNAVAAAASNESG